MQSLQSFGGLLPLWILGAPFIAGVIGLVTAPRPRMHRDPLPAYGLPPARPV